MRKLLVLCLLVALGATGFAQKFPTRPSNGSVSTINTDWGARYFGRGIVIANFSDTTAANNITYMKNEPYIIITTSDHSFWRRSADATEWIKMSGAGGGTSTVNIYNDTTLVICSNGTNLCDTTYITNVGALQTVTILNDSSLEVCGPLICDTLVVPDANFTGTVIIAGSNVSITGSGTPASPYVINSLNASKWTLKPTGYGIYRNSRVAVGGDSVMAKFTVIDNNQLIKPSDTSGIMLANNTDADAGDQIRSSPSLIFKANRWGYGRNKFRAFSDGIYLNIETSMDDGATYKNLFKLNEGFGQGYLQLGDNSFGTVTSIVSTLSVPYTYTSFLQSNGGVTFPAGGAVGSAYRVQVIDNVTNNGSLAVSDAISVEGSVEAYAGTTLRRGFHYRANVVAGAGLTHRAIETEVGDNVFGSTSGSTIIGGTDATSKLTVLDNTLLDTQNDALGISLVNNTPATSLLGERLAPALLWKFNQWDGAATRERKWRLYPSGSNFLIQQAIGAGAYANMVEFRYGVTNPSIVLGANYFGDDCLTGNINATGEVLANTVNAAGSSGISYSGDRVRSHMATTFTTGTNTVNYFLADPSYNNTSGTNLMRGFYYNPAVGSFAGSTHYGFWNTSGDNLLGSTSGSTSVGATTSIPSSRIFQVVSTAKASCPFPVMTSVERLAIASPQIGDHVYQSDGTEGVYTYKSSGWQFAY